MDRIMIIGIAGAGKSTFANKLGKNLNREVIHLDKIHRDSGGQLVYPINSEWKEKVRNIAAEEKWIIDGHYNNTLGIRLPRADTVIFFNFNKFYCLYRSFKRAQDKTQPFDKAEGNLNHISWNLIKKTILFPKKKILNTLAQHENTKKIFIVTNDKEAEELLEILTS